MLKCTKFDFRWGSAPDPLAGFKTPTSKGRVAKMEGRGRMGKGERRKWIGGKEGEGREEEGICRTIVKVLPTPLSGYAMVTIRTDGRTTYGCNTAMLPDDVPLSLHLSAASVVVLCAYTGTNTFADVAHPLLMAGKSTMPAFFDGKYTRQPGASYAQTPRPPPVTPNSKHKIFLSF